MPKPIAFLLVIASLNACGGARAFELSAPAPADVLSCALGAAVQSGYEPTEGGVSAGYIRLLRHRSATAGDVGKEAAARIASLGLMGSSRAEWDVLRVVGAGGRINVVVWALNDDEEQQSPTEEGKADAQNILKACGS